MTTRATREQILTGCRGVLHQLHDGEPNIGKYYKQTLREAMDALNSFQRSRLYDGYNNERGHNEPITSKDAI